MDIQVKTDDMSKTITGYKFVKSDMRSANGSEPPWVLGEWRKHEGKLKLCESGYHASPTALESLQYTFGDRWFVVEAKGKVKKDGNKFVASEMRLVKEIPAKVVAVRFALASARRCLDNFEVKYPEDNRPRQAIEAAEAWVNDQTEEKSSAARSAARSAAWSAAWSAAESAASAAWSAAESAAGCAAWSAASAAGSAASAAGSAAWSAARSAAGSAEQKWQSEELDHIIKEVLSE